jgi:hypothetical protein
MPVQNFSSNCLETDLCYYPREAIFKTAQSTVIKDGDVGFTERTDWPARPHHNHYIRQIRFNVEWADNALPNRECASKMAPRPA